MGDVDTEVARHSTGRRVAGAVVAVLAAVLAVLFVLGTWNPGDLVVLWRHFSNPFRGGMVVFALAFAASWLLAPVDSEARHARRVRWRIGFGLAFVASLLGLGLFGPLFSTDHTELARSPRGDRVAVLYEPGTEFQRLHVWSGRGLGARHTGDLGKPCGPPTVTFRGRDVIHVQTSYGEWDLRLDPSTGKPLNTLGPTCIG